MVAKLERYVASLIDPAARTKASLNDVLQKSKKRFKREAEKLDAGKENTFLLKKLNRISDELKVLEGLTEDDIVRFALTTKQKLMTIAANTRMPKELRMKARVACHKPLSSHLAKVKEKLEESEESESEEEVAGEETSTKLDKITLNNQIVKMRQNVKRSRLNIIHRMTRKITKLRGMKGSDESKAKCEKKAERLVNQIKRIKVLDVDDVSRFALSSTQDLNKLCSDMKTPLTTQVMAIIALHKFVAGPVADFKSKFPDWKLTVPAILRKKKKKRKINLESKDNGKGSSKPMSRVDKNSSSSDHSDSENEESNNENMSTDGDQFDQESDQEQRTIRSEEESEENEEIDNDNETYEMPFKKVKLINKKILNKELSEEESEEAEGSDSEIHGRKSSKSKNDIEIGNDSKTDNIPFKKVKLKNNKTLDKELSHSMKDKKKTESLKLTNTNKNNNKKIDMTKKRMNSNTNVHEIKQKVVDPFFVTTQNEAYLTTQGPGNTEDNRLDGETKNDDFKSTNQNRVKKFESRSKWGNRGDDWRQNKFRRRESQPYTKPLEKIHNNQPLGTGINIFANRKERRKALHQPMQEQKVEKLHPSWEAKKKQTAITAFQGKKITFD